MTEEREPNAADILGSKIGLNTVLGGQVADQSLLTALLFILRRKDVISDKDIYAMIDAASVSLKESFDTTASDIPAGAQYVNEIRAAAEKLIEKMRADFTPSASE